MTVFLALTGVVVVALLSISISVSAAAATKAQQGAAGHDDDLPSPVLRKKTVGHIGIGTVVAVNELPRRHSVDAAEAPNAARALKAPPAATASEVLHTKVPPNAVETSPSNGRFSATGSAALIPVGRLGWHEISDWREIRRAGPSR